jgi:hypothetical protein
MMNKRIGIQHVYHHNDNDGPKVNVKAEKNSKGYNWEATVTGARSVDEALDMLQEAETGLKAMYGEVTSDKGSKAE